MLTLAVKNRKSGYLNKPFQYSSSSNNAKIDLFLTENQEEAGDQINQRKYYEALVGEPCNDPFSCPSCGGVLNDPVTIACGHTFCRQHVMSNTANPSLCLKVRLILNIKGNKISKRPSLLILSSSRCQKLQQKLLLVCIYYKNSNKE